jgi:hypothetical protein
MKQAPSWEANSSWARQELPQNLWSPKAHYHVHKSQLHVPILNQMNPLCTLWSYFFKIWFNIVPLCVPESAGLHIKILYQFLLSHIHATCPTYFICPIHIHMNSFTSALHFTLKWRDYIAILCLVISHKYSCKVFVLLYTFIIGLQVLKKVCPV